MRQRSKFPWGPVFCVVSLLIGGITGCDTETSHDEAGEAIEEGANKVQRRIESTNEEPSGEG